MLTRLAGGHRGAGVRLALEFHIKALAGRDVVDASRRWTTWHRWVAGCKRATVRPRRPWHIVDPPRRWTLWRRWTAGCKRVSHEILAGCDTLLTRLAGGHCRAGGWLAALRGRGRRQGPGAGVVRAAAARQPAAHLALRGRTRASRLLLLCLWFSVHRCTAHSITGSMDCAAHIWNISLQHPPLKLSLDDCHDQSPCHS